MFFCLDRTLHNGQPVTVQRHNGQLVLFNGEQLTGVSGFFVVLAHGVEGFFDHAPQHTGLDGQGMIGTGGGKVRIIGGAHGKNVKFRHTALNGGVAGFVGVDAHLAAGQTANHITQKLGRQNDLTGLANVGFDGGGDAHFQIIAGQRELEALGF